MNAIQERLNELRQENADLKEESLSNADSIASVAGIG